VSSAPRATTLSVSSGNGRCSAFASSQGARPDVALLIGCKDDRHGLFMDPLDHGVRRRGQNQRLGPGTGLDFVPRSPLNSVQMPAKAASGRSSFRANQTISFFLVAGLGSGAYSAKLLNGTRHRFSGLSQPRQCGDEVFRMLVTGGPPLLGGGGIPQRILVSSRSEPALRTTGAG
jgi:hypothetical protein